MLDPFPVHANHITAFKTSGLAMLRVCERNLAERDLVYRLKSIHGQP